MATAAGGRVSPAILSSSDDEGAAGDRERHRAEGSSDEDELTAREFIARITTGWQNEKLAPELLYPLQYELEALRNEVSYMEKNMRKLLPTDIRLSIHRMEIKRLRYIMTSYLRVRILKIQEYPWFYMSRLERSGPPILMPSEEVFLREYLGNLESFLFDVAIENMPITVRKFSKDQLRKTPCVDRYVFFKSDVSISLVSFDANKEREEADIEEGSQYVMRYRPIRKLLHEGKVSLI